jgi:hypothetical protein
MIGAQLSLENVRDSVPLLLALSYFPAPFTRRRGRWSLPPTVPG